ncbi:MAG: DUF5652 family protein [Candidatus Buchananbacteria bacterium]
MYSQLYSQNPWIIVLMLVLALWTIPWKGLALWKSARRGDTAWFIVLLLVNTLGILEILYIYAFSGKKEKKEEPVTPVV